jgi:hypothetical protein
VSSDDEGREPDAIDPTTSTDAAGGASTVPADEPRPDPDDTAHETTDALQDIESKPLAERAPGYQALADRLRAELEQSDPSRGSS